MFDTVIPASFQYFCTRLTRWEYWPAWAVYLPLLPYIAWLTLRHRGLIVTAVNPGIPLSGMVGESKSSILGLLPARWTIPFVSLSSNTTLDELQALLIQQKWEFPLIFKPDVGERGSSVKLIRTLADAERYLAAARRDDWFPVIAQPFHPGPFEAGIFYVRNPASPRGRIFSITDKVFATVTGDGNTSLRGLILQHPRYALQSAVFLQRLGVHADRVPATGEIVKLNIAGNHCQGTMFLEGRRLWTQALEDQLDAISKQISGFYFGRFDVRYSDPEAFCRGEDIAIVELNGLLSESTNIYDPSYSFFRGQAILRDQWRHAFEIAAVNRSNGCRVAALKEIVAEIRRHKARRTPSLSD